MDLENTTRRLRRRQNGVEMASYSHIWMSPGHFHVVLDVASFYLNLSTVCDRGLGGPVLSLDQEKAFDRVDWCYLLRALERMNFGEIFRQWVSFFYSRIFSNVLVNWEQSAFSLFLVESARGVLCHLFYTSSWLRLLRSFDWWL